MVGDALTTTDPSYLEYRQWQRDHPVPEPQEIWHAAYLAGKRAGIRQSAHLGVSVLVQQLQTVLERLECVSHSLAEAELGSPYWSSDD